MTVLKVHIVFRYSDFLYHLISQQFQGNTENGNWVEASLTQARNIPCLPVVYLLRLTEIQMVFNSTMFLSSLFWQTDKTPPVANDLFYEYCNPYSSGHELWTEVQVYGLFQTIICAELKFFPHTVRYKRRGAAPCVALRKSSTTLPAGSTHYLTFTLDMVRSCGYFWRQEVVRG